MMKEDFLKALLIAPSFPNWEKSFVSGPQSQLYSVEHRLSQDPIALLTQVLFKDAAEGPPGHIHGGATAGLIDEVMGILVWNQGYRCVTQSLNLRYRKPIPLRLETYVVTQISTVSEKKIEVTCTIYDQEKTPYVQAEGVFHRLSADQLNRFKKN